MHRNEWFFVFDGRQLAAIHVNSQFQFAGISFYAFILSLSLDNQMLHKIPDKKRGKIAAKNNYDKSDKNQSSLSRSQQQERAVKRKKGTGAK